MLIFLSRSSRAISRGWFGPNLFKSWWTVKLSTKKSLTSTLKITSLTRYQPHSLMKRDSVWDISKVAAGTMRQLTKRYSSTLIGLGKLILLTHVLSKNFYNLARFMSCAEPSEVFSLLLWWIFLNSLNRTKSWKNLSESPVTTMTLSSTITWSQAALNRGLWLSTWAASASRNCLSWDSRAS